MTYFGILRLRDALFQFKSNLLVFFHIASKSQSSWTKCHRICQNLTLKGLHWEEESVQGKQQCKRAAQIRWQSKSAEKQLSELQVEYVSEHVLSAHGEATTSANSSSADLHAGQDNVPLPDEQDDQCAARRKLDLMRKYVGETDDTDSDKERCFMEIRSLKSLF